MNTFFTQTLEEPPSSQVVDAQRGVAIPLAMQRLDLEGEVGPAGALLRVTHSFKCEGDAAKPLEALYHFMLPRDGVVRRFIVRGDGFKVESKLALRGDARKKYEAGLADGHLSSLAEASLDGLVNLSIGQIRPGELVTVIVEVVSGVDLRDDGWRFRFPFTLAPAYHDKAKMIPTAEGGKIELPADVFGDLILPEWKTSAKSLHQVGFRLRATGGGEVDSVVSPSHRISVRTLDANTAEVSLATVGDAPNRDLVLDMNVRRAVPTVFADGPATKGDAKLPAAAPRWMAIIPSSEIPRGSARTARSVCFVLDHSGSMSGSRLEQAKAALAACLSALTPKDSFGLLAFDHQVMVFDPAMAKATEQTRQAAGVFLDRVKANGGTCLGPALGKAVEILGRMDGEIVLLTDGEVSETGPLLGQATTAGIPIHVLGIGTAAQDRFLAALARRTGGIQKMVGPRENVAGAALVLFNSIRTPVAKDVTAIVTAGRGKKARAFTVGTVWDGRAMIVIDDGLAGKVPPTKIRLEWGKTFHEVKLGKAIPTSTGLVALLWAGRQVQDLESALDASQKGPAHSAFERDLQKLSEDYGLASRVMSLYAVIERAGDRKGADPVQRVVPVGMPEDAQPANIFGTLSAGPLTMLSSCNLGGVTRGISCSSSTSMGWGEVSEPHVAISTLEVGHTWTVNPAPSITDFSLPDMSLLSELATLCADGGLPGPDLTTRVFYTTIFALAVLKAHVEGGSVMYGLHLGRMADFLEAHTVELGTGAAQLVSVLRAGRRSPVGDWSAGFRTAKADGSASFRQSAWAKVAAELANL